MEISERVILIIQAGFGEDGGRERQLDLVVNDLVPHGDVLHCTASLQGIPLEASHDVFTFNLASVISGGKASCFILDGFKFPYLPRGLRIPSCGGVFQLGPDKCLVRQLFACSRGCMESSLYQAECLRCALLDSVAMSSPVELANS